MLLLAYRTEAEKYGTSALIHLVVQAERKYVLGVAAGSPRWLTPTSARPAAILSASRKPSQEKE
jgi:hypothetical protein